jgi:hypothetical protein
MGDTSHPYTAAQNALVARVCFLVALCVFRKVHWIIEQPASSIMWNHPLMSQLIAEVKPLSALVQLGAYSLESMKPLTLVGTGPWLENMARKMTRLEKLAMRGIGLLETTPHCSYNMG